LEHIADGTANLVRIAEQAVGPYTVAVCSGGWSQMASVRALKERVLPGLVFSPVTRPGCRGAAALGAVAAVGSGDQDSLADLMREWSRTDPLGVPRLDRIANDRSARDRSTREPDLDHRWRALAPGEPTALSTST